MSEDILIEPDRHAEVIRAWVRDNPSIVNDEYQDTAADPISVACYPMCEAYYHLNNCEPEVYCLSWTDVDPSLDGTHWYLREHGGERRWIDLGLPLEIDCDDLPPYDHGTHRGWITGDNPSKRCQRILNQIAPMMNSKTQQ